jgi:hypothetical protein
MKKQSAFRSAFFNPPLDRKEVKTASVPIEQRTPPAKTST